jgi:hypothetical protein
MIIAMFMSAAAHRLPSCRGTSSGGTQCRPVTANSTDERRTDDQGPAAKIGCRACDLLLPL